jgi:catechol 2,3-dioxygenase-like lactoylglutathione lyase family enzyme
MTPAGNAKSVLTDSAAFSGFAVRDVAAAKAFYADVLGLAVTEDHGILSLHLAGGTTVIAYPKPDHVAAGYTILNFPVADIDAAVDELMARGVTFARYETMPQDERGVMRAGGPFIAWFADPSGNVLSVLQDR